MQVLHAHTSVKRSQTGASKDLSMQRNLLKMYISEVIKEEATVEDVYGQYLFGTDRGLPEPDNEPEMDMNDKFRNVFDGFMSDMTKQDVDLLVKLRDEGKYADILQVPPYAKRAWRTIQVTMSKIPPALHPGINKNTAIRTQMFKQAQVFTGNVTMPLHNYSVNSWTISHQALSRLAQEDIGEGDYIILLSVDLSSQKNKFILNPGNLQQVNFMYFWQAEIWQVAPVVCDKWAIVRQDAGAEEIDKAVQMVK